jgi:hypothetical protein
MTAILNISTRRTGGLRFLNFCLTREYKKL